MVKGVLVRASTPERIVNIGKGCYSPLNRYLLADKSAGIALNYEQQIVSFDAPGSVRKWYVVGN